VRIFCWLNLWHKKVKIKNSKISQNAAECKYCKKIMKWDNSRYFRYCKRIEM